MGLNLKKTFLTDKSKENQGVWVDLGEGARLLIARHGNERFKLRYQELTAPYAAAIRTKTLSEAVAEKILKQILAETILLDWEGIVDDDGNPVPYSVEKAMEFLDIPDFRSFVEEMSKEQALYRKELEAQAEKNSLNSSNGK